MKGWREILISFGVGMSALLVYNGIPMKEARYVPGGEPVQGDARQDDPALASLEGMGVAHAMAARTQPPRETSEVVVAVIDTGCDVHHPSLSAGIWTNPGESGLDENGIDRAQNGIDDDDNGLVDDVHGWNFSSGTAEIGDDHGHGTHIAGIIRNGSADSERVKLMILKYYDAENDGQQNLRHTIEAIRYAVRMKAKIINYSGGGVLKSRDEEEAIRWAGEQGVLVVAAAGNEGLNSDFFHFYPADYDSSNIISVAALDRQGNLIPMSNFGAQTVDLAAPGKNIFSTLPGGEFGYMTGTSQATAWVTGGAALLMSQDERLHDPAVMISLLLTHTRDNASLKGRSRTGGELNLKLALESLENESRWRISQTGKNRAPARDSAPN